MHAHSVCPVVLCFYLQNHLGLITATAGCLFTSAACTLSDLLWDVVHRVIKALPCKHAYTQDRHSAFNGCTIKKNYKVVDESHLPSFWTSKKLHPPWS